MLRLVLVLLGRIKEGENSESLRQCLRRPAMYAVRTLSVEQIKEEYGMPEKEQESTIEDLISSNCFFRLAY